MIYRRKIATTEAEQWNGGVYQDAKELYIRLGCDTSSIPIIIDSNECLVLRSKNGQFFMRAFPGDYIVKDADGCLLAVSKHYFEKEWIV